MSTDEPGDPIEAEEEPEESWTEFVSRLGAASSGPEWDRQARAAATEKEEAARQMGAELNNGNHAGIMPLFNHEAINGLEGESDSSGSEDEEEQRATTTK